MLKWLTCTPRDFPGDEGFFSRDSGLLCRGFQANGISCRAVMTGAPRPDDQPDLIRVELAVLASPAWWGERKSEGVEGVVLYAWGRPEFARIARAIREAGLLLVSHQDSSGVISPKTGWSEWTRLKWWIAAKRGALRIPAFVAGMARSIAPGRLGYEAGRLEHLREANVIGVVCPDAVRLYQQHLHAYGEPGLAERVRLVPHPVGMTGILAHEPKRKQVICAGRWDAWWQKRPDLLMKTLEGFLKQAPDWRVVIAGTPTDKMNRWHAGLAPEIGRRVEITGILPHGRLLARMAESSIAFCPSNYESFHITSAEVLCCGGTVVAADSPLLGSFRWFAEDGCGTLSNEMGEEPLKNALIAEARNWDSGSRDPDEIASKWQSRLRAEAVAKRIVEVATR